MATIGSSSSSDLLYVDDFYFSALFDDDEPHSDDQIFQISDDKYAEELQLQEALMSSVMASPATGNIVGSSISVACSSSTSAHPITVLEFDPFGKKSGESSLSLSFCEICVEGKEINQMFRNDNCVHSFCLECICKYVATKINENLNGAISCPSLDCKSSIQLEACRDILPKNVVERWDEALCEALVLAAEKAYCPYKDCSAVMVFENEVIMESECPVCHRLFCAQCQVPWHPGIACEDYQRLNEDERGRDDLLIRELAREKKWKRCPHCKFFVEKTEGCLHITCRCRFEFCYACGSDWSKYHGGCQPN